MISDSDGRMTGRQARVVKLSTAVLALLLALLILGVGELYVLRAAGRHDVRTLACYTVRYSPDSDPTAREIRQAYHCPPARAVPAVPAVRPSHSPGQVSASRSAQRVRLPAAAAPSAGPAAPRPPRSAPVATVQPPASPSPSASSTGLLGGLLCDLHRLPVCLR